MTGGPFFEDIERGHVDDGPPALTLTDGLAAAHTAILGSRLRLPLDVTLSRRVVGSARALAHPALVCDVAIGQSTRLTQRVIANLFYRGLVFRRLPLIGDTLRTTTEVVALKQNRRTATGLVVLRVVTVDQADRPVLDFTRCAMLPLRDADGTTGHDDPIDGEPLHVDADTLAAPVAGWRLDAMPASSEDLSAGMSWDVAAGDVVTAAPELARLSLNVAMAHHDHRAGMAGARLVYGGHTIGLAAAQLTRALPNLATIVAWRSCRHLAPVFEGDTLTSTIVLERSDGDLLYLRSRVRALRSTGECVDVLDWRLVAVHP